MTTKALVALVLVAAAVTAAPTSTADHCNPDTIPIWHCVKELLDPKATATVHDAVHAVAWLDVTGLLP